MQTDSFELNYLQCHIPGSEKALVCCVYYLNRIQFHVIRSCPVIDLLMVLITLGKSLAIIFY